VREEIFRKSWKKLLYIFCIAEAHVEVRRSKFYSVPYQKIFICQFLKQNEEA